MILWSFTFPCLPRLPRLDVLLACLAFSFFKTDAVCRQGMFKRHEKGNFSASNILSRHYVGSSFECGQQCLHEGTCVAFKYRLPTESNEPNRLISNNIESSSESEAGRSDGAWTIYEIFHAEPRLCLENNPCKNGGKCVGSPCEPDGFKCICHQNFGGRFCENITGVFSSCNSLLQASSKAKNGPFKIKTNTTLGTSHIYCQMTSLPGCDGGGWTMVMKIDGNKTTFHYNSSYWSNYSSYNPAGGLTAFDDQETKLPTYWSTSFKELCVGMKVRAELNFVSINYSANSLHSLIADGKYRQTNIGRQKWKSLISGSSLQSNCNLEGFNIVRGSLTENVRTRLGVVGNEQENCASPDSFLGFGGKNESTYCHPRQDFPTICGNLAYCEPDNGNKDIKSMGYILVR